MNKIFETLENQKYRIKKLIINGFTTESENINIDIYISTVNDCNKKLHFSKVKDINIDNVYGSSTYSSIIISETTDFLIPTTKKYHVEINEDIMTFYCDKIEIKSII